MLKEVVEGVRMVVKARNSDGSPSKWHLYPTGKPQPYFGTVYAGDIASENRALHKFLTWKDAQGCQSWYMENEDRIGVDVMFVGMREWKNVDLRNTRLERIVKDSLDEYKKYIRDLILTDGPKAAIELDIEELKWFDQIAPPSPSLSLDTIGDLYINRPKKISPGWKSKTIRMWQEFLQCVQVETVREITNVHINRYHEMLLEHLRKGKSPTWVSHRMGIVKAILNYASKQGQDQEQVERVLKLCKSLIPPRKSGMAPDPISPKHFKRMLKCFKDKPKWKAIYLLSLNAALYPSEVGAVKKQEIDLTKGTLVMNRNKTGIPRIATLWPRTIKAIQQYLKKEPHDSELLFITYQGNQYDGENISRFHRKYRSKANVPESVQFAHIRDGALTAACNDNSVQEKQEKLLAGHRSGMSDHYVKRDPYAVKEACNAIEKKYFKSKKQGKHRNNRTAVSSR